MKIYILISGLVLSAASGMAQIGVETRQYDTGTVGINFGQTARFNVLYPTIPAPFATQVLCSATLTIADDQNNILKTQTVTQLTGGRSVSIDLNADTDIPLARGRTQIHAVVLTPAAGTSGAACNFVPTLELVDNTSGKTTIVLKGQATWPPASTALPLKSEN